MNVALAQKGIRNLVQLARLAKVSDSTIWQVACGLVPSEEVRGKIAGALGLDADELWAALPESVIEGGR